MRLALLAGEKSEGWRAHVQLGHAEPTLVSLSAAPFHPPTDTPCDPRVAYLVVIRPAGQASGEDEGALTAVGGLIARSRAMLRVFGLIENLRHSEATVLVTGERRMQISRLPV